ncbi:MAG: glycosylasparaginase [Bacteroidetes bacterium HGW-Bacteroidetes-1]|jgi:isoaspartyl peptidase/L-asparaginase-like protein (Ntn-hydrolase superfamily)|nr:MAG: glycosylasparaginase [Bacteroidetes bacterium HGW-Bacteroidetes-1]
MGSRRRFLIQSFLGAIATGFGFKYGFGSVTYSDPNYPQKSEVTSPVIISTWSHGLAANQAAWNVVSSGGSALDAVERGVNVSEADPEVSSVGYGGLPDASGNVTLDACIMGPDGNAGAVAFLKHIMHPVSVARKVMENTPHLMLAGDGALKFALDQGFKKVNLLTPEARKAFKAWKRSGARYAPMANWENHDTIGLLAIDQKGDLAGACTTSGMAFKHPGRVGDSPIIGAGLFVDNKIGGATATGEGEVVMKTLGSFLIVELMRNGMHPQEACEAAIYRLTETTHVHKNMQIGYIAVNKNGEHGAFSLRPGFQYAVFENGQNELLDTAFLMDWE